MVKEHCLDLEVVGNIDNSSRAETRGTTSSRREATADDGVRNVSSVFIRVPCRIIRHARQTIHRLLKWVDYTPSFFRLCGILNPQEESPTWKRVGERASASWVQLKLQFDRFNFRDESQVVVGEERSDHVLAQVVNSLHPTTTNQRSSVPCSEDFFGKFYGIESIACRINPAFIQQAI